MKIILLTYLLIAILLKLFRHTKIRGLKEWIPADYCNEFVECKIDKDESFLKGDEIPKDSPTIFILGKIKTTNNTILFLDFLTDIFTFGFLRFNEIIPVGEPATLRIYFKNISKINASIQGGKTDFAIIYPNSDTPARTWQMKIPDLMQVGESCYIESKRFFCPEVPGTHVLRISGATGIVVAGPYGVSDRRYRIPLPGAPWIFLFHVSSGYEYKTFIVAFLALTVAVISMLF